MTAKGKKVPFSPDGALTLGEIGVVRNDLFSPVLVPGLLPDKAVNESRQRVTAALAAMGLSLPPKVITINLSPADLP